MRAAIILLYIAIMNLPSSLSAEELTIERLVASPSLAGPVAKGVQISPDGSRVTFLQGKTDNQDQLDLWEYRIADGEKRLLVDSTALLGGSEELDEVERARRERARNFSTGIVEYAWSPDGRALLFPLGGDLFYLEPGSEVRRLTQTPGTETDARISPTGGYVSFIREQNLYVIELTSGKERAITTRGEGSVSYGMAEFVAQEEMYRFTGYWWAKDDSRLAFTRIDESGVALKNRYEINAAGVTTIEQRYPFAGTANAVVELFVMDLDSGAVREVGLGEDKDFYLARVDFSPDGTLAVQKQSRDQRRLDLIFIDPVTMDQGFILHEEQPNWINLHSDLHFLAGGDQFIWTSERSGFNHIYLYRKDGQLIRPLTGGHWAVAQAGRGGGGVRAVDEAGGYVWFAAFPETTTEKHLYRIPLSGGEMEQMTAPGGWYEASVAADGSFFVENGQGPLRPPYTAIRASSGELLMHITENPLDENHPYYPYLNGHRDFSYGTIEAEDGTLLNYRLALPADFDPARKYPAVVFLYGGPGGPEVTKTWSVNGRLDGFNQVLARNGYVVFTLDNRGTSERGKAFEDVIYRSMGDFEVRDQLQGLKWLKSQSYVDADNVGVHGWSYGGYMTLMLLLKAPGAFNAGIAGAPVTNWRLYDTHYTERYMGDPDDGDGRYETASPITYAQNLRDPLLIVHGMADDNVFFDHTVQMIDALQKAALPFEMMTYPGKRHRIVGEAENTQMWNMYLKFFNRHLTAE
ncbi:MAG: S9 family peptidase [Gammaproteobacteria bacterium]|nr:S9 family peptidase [Gammaproteobacteria bacterium]